MGKANKNVKKAPDLEEEDNLGFLIHETARAITLAYGTVMAPLGLTRPQVRVVAWVEHHPGITQTELCEFIPISPMAMTGLLDRMASKDLIKRVDDPSDRRGETDFSDGRCPQTDAGDGTDRQRFPAAGPYRNIRRRTRHRAQNAAKHAVQPATDYG